MGSYNPRNKEYLYAAIRSIIHQSFPDWELLLYDDGSDKPFAATLRDVSKMDRRIHYLRGASNQGLAHALNQCIRYAKGKYLARMDDDDLSLPLRLETQVRFLDNQPQYQWVGCAAWLFDKDVPWGKQVMPKSPQNGDFPPTSIPLWYSAGRSLPWQVDIPAPPLFYSVKTMSCLCDCMLWDTGATIYRIRCFATAKTEMHTTGVPMREEYGK